MFGSKKFCRLTLILSAHLRFVCTTMKADERVRMEFNINQLTVISSQMNS